MPGKKGDSSRLVTHKHRLHRHRLRTDAAYRISVEVEFMQECQRRRNRIVVLGTFTRRIPEPFTLAEAVAWLNNGCQVPMDLLPREYWHPPDQDYPIFSEEALGSKF